MDRNKIFEIGKQIGEIIGTYCNDEQIEIFEKMLKDYKIKDRLIDVMADAIIDLDSYGKYTWDNDKKKLIEFLINQVKEQDNGSKV